METKTSINGLMLKSSMALAVIGIHLRLQHNDDPEYREILNMTKKFLKDEHSELWQQKYIDEYFGYLSG